MWRYFLSRLGWAIPIIIAILAVNFVIIHAVPGDPIQAFVGDFPTPPGYIEKIREEFGLDKPLLLQLGIYFGNLLKGHLGYSFANRQDVLTLVLHRAKFTLLLMLPALTISGMLGVVMAVKAAPRSGSIFDSSITVLSLFGYSVPIFWLGQVLMLVFSIHLGWLPVQGMVSLRESYTGWAAVADVIWHMVLPGFGITIFYVAVVARVARASLVQALSQDFIMTAKAKGLHHHRVLWRHALPNAIIPVVIVVGYNFGASLTGAILVESVFAWPGVGNLFITSIGNRDYPVLQGIFLFAGISVVLANVVTDLVCAALDPRIRRSYKGWGR